ncbi:MAG: amino acid adenylation domain-containing protein [Microcystis aeruginosa L211-101]|nr:amino acid adenylation domain-containing protein [Microcystis aeruginosa L211-11]NCR29394.1 amino acid adenylation domain-containing protein [Microcystis aeruginosa L211-101]
MADTKNQPAKNVESIYPLSPMQEGMLFHSLYTPDSGIYCSQTLITLEGEINLAVFRQAWEKVVERHSVLRTLFLWEKREKPLQIVRKKVDLPWDYQDWRNLSPTEQQQRLDLLLQTERQQGFEFKVAPLMRCLMIQLSDQTYKFLCNHHHIILDGWSMPIIYQEVLGFYEAGIQGKSYHLPLPRPYQDYIVWLQQQNPSIAESFWQRTLEGFMTPTPLRVDRLQLMKSEGKPTYKEHNCHLSASHSKDLQSLAQKHNLTLSTLVQAAWAILLSRYSGESEVLFGVTVSGRPHDLSGVEHRVGLFINTLPLRVSIRESDLLLSWLQELQQKQAEIQDYAYVSLAEIQRLSDIPPGVPLFESLVVFENYPREALSRDSRQSLRVKDVENFEETNYPLTVVAIPKQELLIQLVYDTSRFTQDTIERMAAHLQTILTGIVTDTRQRVTQLPILTTQEQHQLLVEWNNTEADYPLDKSLHQLFEEQAAQNPQGIAVIFEGQKLTYQQLNNRGNQLAHCLRDKGVGPESLVGIFMERSLEMVIGLLGILKAGGAYVPLDPDYPTERLGDILSDSGVSLVLTQESLGDFLPQTGAELLCLDRDWEKIATYSPENPFNLTTPENLAYVIYTSGSTGKPKGVLISHRGLMNLICWHQDAFEITPLDKTTQLARSAFDAAVWELWPCLTAGASLVLVKPEIMQSPPDLRDWLIAQEITVSFLPTPLVEKILSLEWDENIALRIILTGGDKLHHYPSVSMPFKLINNYGPTENSVVTTSGLVPDYEEGNSSSPSIGKPISNTKIYILDRNLQPLPIGVPGELHISSVGLARGYLNRLELTQEKFISNPFNSGILYKTGDLVRYLPDGNIEFLGRIDNQVKLRGLRIELGEIQTVLETHPNVEQTVVIMREDTLYNQRLVAYVIRKDTLLTPQDLRRFLQQQLPAYMVPSAFVLLSDFPLNNNGKIDRKKLPIPDETSIIESAYIAPRNQKESLLAQIWQDVLQVSKIGVSDNFFELGGHSLKAISLVSKIQEKLGQSLPIKQVFAHPTIAEQAALLSTVTPLTVATIPLVSAQETYETSHAQRRFYVLQQMDLNNVAYHIVSTLKIAGDFSPDVFEKAIQLLISRHESLRTSFILINGEPQQKILQNRPFDWEFKDWTNKPDEEILETIAKERKPFDLEKSPLVRSKIYKLSANEYILELEIHHIICDGWSMSLLAKECLQYYSDLAKGLQPSIEPLPIQYKDYAGWQNNLLRSENNPKNLDYWRQKLDNGQLTRVHLPTDFKRPQIKTFKGSHLSWTFDRETISKLRKICQENEITLFMALVAAVKILLYRYSGQHDITIGTEIATRSHPQLQSLIGLFLNTLVIRDQIEPEKGYKNLLAKVRQTVTEALEHSDYPFDILVEKLAVSREINRTPLFDILVLLQNFDQPVGLENIQIKSLDSLTPTSKFDLSFVFSEDQEKLRLELIYNTDLFQEERMKKCLIHFDKLLNEMLSNPAQPVKDISLLSEAETAFIANFINPIPRLETRTIIHDFIDQVAAKPEKTSIIYPGGKFSYQELHELTNFWAYALKELGVEKDKVCGVLLEGDYRQLIAMLAVFKAGGIYLPLRLDEPEERRQRMMIKTSPEIILVAAENLEGIKPQLSALEKPPHILVVKAHKIQQYHQWNGMDYQEFPCQLSKLQPLLAMPDADDSNYIMFTSGSTGEPKAILGSHGSLRHFIDWEKREFGINESWRCLQIAQINFDAYLRETCVTLCSGGTLYIPESTEREDLELLLLRIGEWKINLLHTVPSVMRLFLKMGRGLVNAHNLLKSLRIFVLGGEPLFVKELAEWHQIFGSQTEFVNIYGASETTFVKHFYRIPNPNNIPYERVPGGQTLPDAAYAVVDGNRARAIGEVGEVFVKSPYLTKGYYQDESLTHSVFVPNPLNGGRDIVYRTGDLGRLLPDLTLEVIGRSDNQIKLNGVRIELGEIEDVLSGIEGVEKALVMANKKEELVNVIAYYQAEDTVHQEYIRGKLKQLLPIYMQPSFLMRLEAFPLLPNGKIHRLALPKPEENITDSTNQVPDFNPQEALLASLWGELLEAEVSNSNQSFFELGGNSLKAMRLVSQIRNQFGVSLRLREIFTHNTLKEQAVLIQSRQKR